MVDRDELIIVYRTLYELAASWPGLPSAPRGVFDHDPASIKNGSFPCVGIKRFSDVPIKRIDKNEEYARTEQNGKTYAWYEAGRMSTACTVALFMKRTPEVPDPTPYVRSWSEYVTKRVLNEVRLTTFDDPVPGEFVHIKPLIKPFEQQGRTLVSSKLSLTVEGKYLIALELQQPSEGGRMSWIVHQNPDILH